MSAIPFTDRELTRAWRDLSAIAKPTAHDETRRNAQRLLLFYAVECGLKAVWLKHKCRKLFDQPDIKDIGHDLRGILKDLNVGSELSLPDSVQLSPVTRDGIQVSRKGGISILHQVWRYGGQCTNPNDDVCEAKLQKVLDWIRGELK